MHFYMQKFTDARYGTGSALILTVVLTSLLGMVGVLFLLTARLNSMATSSISESQDLDYAVDSVLAQISQVLADDVPDDDEPNKYYDYPDDNNPWLSNLEPNESARWRHISDINDRFGPNAWDVSAVVIEEYQDPCDPAHLWPLADADGDGVSDALWTIVQDVNTSKGKPVYAAVRIIDNCAMLNLNTAYKFDLDEPNLSVHDIDGSSQMQIDLAALAHSSQEQLVAGQEQDLMMARANYGAGGIDVYDLDNYEKNVIWRYVRPVYPYTPFDISDEMELRNRFIVNHPDIDVRIENLGAQDGRVWHFRQYCFRTPVQSADDLIEWFITTSSEPALSPGVVLDPNYAYRHIATTYNYDRIIGADGKKLVNINKMSKNEAEDFYDKFKQVMLRYYEAGEADRIAGQFAANLLELSDEDTEMENLQGYYGFEAQPFITELAIKVQGSKIYYALELYNPFAKEIELGGGGGGGPGPPASNFELELIYDTKDANSTEKRIPLTTPQSMLAGGCLIFSNKLSTFGLTAGPYATQTNQLKFFGDWNPPDVSKPPSPPGQGGTDPAKPPEVQTTPDANGIIYLKRRAQNGQWIYIDKQEVDKKWADEGGFFGRDVHDWHVVYQTVKRTGSEQGTLGARNPVEFDDFNEMGHKFSFFMPNPYPEHQTPFADPNYSRFRTVGDIARMLTLGHGTEPNSTIGQQLKEIPRDQEHRIRLDLQDPRLSEIFQYITVFDPTNDGIDNDNDGTTDKADDPNEWKIPGRININTAPWFVIAKLPWMTEPLAKAIVAYRDKLAMDSGPDYSGPTGRFDSVSPFLRPEVLPIGDEIREAPGFASIGELNFVLAGDPSYNITQGLHFDGEDMPGLTTDPDEYKGPDLTTFPDGTGDGITDDFEERDAIFSRISNLVTVRSDVFTAYILVRLGKDGPQRRVIALLDRSGARSATDGDVEVVALYPVPDPR